MESPAIDRLPGFRRRFRVTPGPGQVLSEVEDDFHSMKVRLRHDGRVVTSVEADLIRAPWTTCPGAAEQLERTFTGVALKDCARRGEKPANCTHLHDLATLAATHAHDSEVLVYDVHVSDPVDGVRQARLRRNGEPLLSWTESGFKLVGPPEVAGLGFDQLRPWLESLDPARREAARILRWANMIANGRIIPMAQQSDATRMPSGSCYTFQPARQLEARRVGRIRNFAPGMPQPLEKEEPAL